MERYARFSIFIGSELMLYASADLWPDVLTPGSWVVTGFLIGSGLMILNRWIPYVKENVSKPRRGSAR
jgi:hypothetical protein